MNSTLIGTENTFSIPINPGWNGSTPIGQRNPRSRGEHLARRCGKAERIVEFPVREQAGVGGDHRSAKLKHQPAVEIEPENLAIRFTRRVRRGHLD